MSKSEVKIADVPVVYNITVAIKSATDRASFVINLPFPFEISHVSHELNATLVHLSELYKQCASAKTVESISDSDNEGDIYDLSSCSQFEDEY